MADILQITLPDGTTYNIKDNNALPLTGGQVTGPVTFGDSVLMDDLTVGNIIVTGSLSIVQGLPWSSIINTPTTLAGYGIADANFLPLSGGTLTGELIMDHTRFRVDTTTGVAINYRYLGSDSTNTLGIAYGTADYTSSTRQTKVNSMAGLAIFRVPNIKNSNLQSSKFMWAQNSVDTSLNPTGYYEYYSLPETTNNLAATVMYDILTSKNAVTIAQGGTGATDAANARTNLGLAAAAVKGVDTTITVSSTSTNLPTSAAVATFVNNLKGTANGIAELDNNGKVLSSQLPSYVDDVIEGYYYNSKFYEDSAHTSEITGETGKIYIDLSTEKTYRWSGTAYAEISASLALGETNSTAYRGDRGKTAYDHSQLTSGNPHNVSKTDVGLGNVDNVQQYSASNPPPYPVTSVNGSTGAVTLTIPTKTSDLTNDSEFITGMTILSYGSSTWNDFINAYDANKVVYCRASPNANPASGSQTRLAFMAYVNNATIPKYVEFQYYRSVSSHTEAQQGDQVFVYTLDKNTGWSVTTRETSVKVAYNNGITGTYSDGVMTLKHANSAITAQSTQAIYPIAIDAYGHITGYGSAVTIPEIPTVTSSDNGKFLRVVNGAWAADTVSNASGVSF